MNNSPEDGRENTMANLIRCFRAHKGVMRDFLTSEQKTEILEGRKNCAKNSSPYAYDRMNAGADSFFADHPFVLVGKSS